MKLPDMPRDGVPVKDTVHAIIDYLRATKIRSFVGGQVRESANGTTLSVKPSGTSKPNKDTLPPFHVRLGVNRGESPTYYVTITDGYVNEIIPGGTGDALAKHFPENIKDGDDRAMFTVTAGKQVSLIVEVDEHGAITASGGDPAVRVAIEDVDPESTHYEPKIGDASTGEAGIYRYQLATIEAPETEGGSPVLKRVLSGSHIQHFRELPKLINLPAASTANTGRLVKEYDKASNQYRFRSIAKGDGQLRIDESGDNVTVRGNGKAATIRYQVAGSSAVDVASFVDGLCDTTGTVTIPIPIVTGKNVNLHVRNQSEGTDPDGWVNHNVSAKTLCFRNGLLAGTITQADPDALTEICTDIEVSAPGDLISMTCSDIDPVS